MSLYMTPYIKERQAHFNQIVKRFLPSKEMVPGRLHEAMIYSVANGGKRLRPLLVYATGEMLGQSLSQLDRAACCVEFIHTYSLIHDDLPAMDNSDFRRNQPACHKVYGEALAILAGNALQNLAFELLAEDESHPLALRLEMIKVLSHGVGSEGVLGGQVLDLEALKKELDVSQIEKIHLMKTAALIVASVKLGALASGHSDVQMLKKLEKMAFDLGLAFQIGDDISDRDEKDSLNYANQTTLHQAQMRMAALYESVSKCLKSFTTTGESLLYEVMEYILTSQNLFLKNPSL